jgi:hypothetical protein
MPAAAAEGWTAVLAGLIPLAGLLGVGYLIYRAARDGGDDDGDD